MINIVAMQPGHICPIIALLAAVLVFGVLSWIKDELFFFGESAGMNLLARLAVTGLVFIGMLQLCGPQPVTPVETAPQHDGSGWPGMILLPFIALGIALLLTALILLIRRLFFGDRRAGGSDRTPREKTRKSPRTKPRGRDRRYDDE